MFVGGLRETQQAEVQIQGVSHRAMTKILDFLYTSEIDLDLECVQEVLEGATLLQVSLIFLHFLLFFHLLLPDPSPLLAGAGHWLLL